MKEVPRTAPGAFLTEAITIVQPALVVETDEQEKGWKTKKDVC
jgi:hypothetical protein